MDDGLTSSSPSSYDDDANTAAVVKIKYCDHIITSGRIKAPTVDSLENTAKIFFIFVLFLLLLLLRVQLRLVF
jgi:hypothetical protein